MLVLMLMVIMWCMVWFRRQILCFEVMVVLVSVCSWVILLVNVVVMIIWFWVVMNLCSGLVSMVFEWFGCLMKILVELQVSILIFCFLWVILCYIIGLKVLFMMGVLFSLKLLVCMMWFVGLLMISVEFLGIEWLIGMNCMLNGLILIIFGCGVWMWICFEGWFIFFIFSCVSVLVKWW